MANPTWAQLAKSQDDDQTIEEFINAKILEHEQDEESHLGAGESLQSHKASEIIDHLAESIVNDKIADGVVDVLKMDYSKIVITPALESVDSWIQTIQGSGGSITSFGNCVEIKTGNANGNITRMYLSLGNYQAVYPEFFPFFDVKARFLTYGYEDFSILCGGESSDSGQQDCFGFELLKDDTKIKAVYLHEGTRYTTEITGPTRGDLHRFRAECVAGSSAGLYSIKYFIDGVLVHTYTDIEISTESNIALAFLVKNKANFQYDVGMLFSNIIYCQTESGNL